MLQLLNRTEPPNALLAVEAADQAPAMTALSISNGAAPAAVVSNPPAPAPREVQAAVRVIEPTYTVEAGDTLARIAARYNTTAERIQALNNLPDPRTLRIGARLIIPAPL